MLKEVKWHDLANLMLSESDYDEWCSRELDDIALKGEKKGLDELPPLERDKEEVKVKEGKRIKILTPNKVLNKLLVLLA